MLSQNGYGNDGGVSVIDNDVACVFDDDCVDGDDDLDR